MSCRPGVGKDVDSDVGGSGGDRKLVRSLWGFLGFRI